MANRKIAAISVRKKEEGEEEAEQCPSVVPSSDHARGIGINWT